MTEAERHKGGTGVLVLRSKHRFFLLGLACLLVVAGLCALAVRFAAQRAQRSRANDGATGWYDAILAVKAKADRGMSQYGDMVDGVARATMVPYAAEREFTNMKEAQTEAVTAIEELTLPFDLSASDREELQAALTQIVSGLKERAAVMDEYLPYAKDRRAVNVQAAEERMEHAQEALRTALDGADAVKGRLAGRPR